MKLLKAITGEIVSYNKFGEGMMVTRAKIVPLSGTVTNIFFFNRQDQPWNNNQWYEYDWEIRGKSPSSGWSQIRVRPQAGQALKDAPVDVKAKIKLSNKLLHYVLIRKGNTYVYDIRRPALTTIKMPRHITAILPLYLPKVQESIRPEGNWPIFLPGRDWILVWG